MAGDAERDDAELRARLSTLSERISEAERGSTKTADAAQPDRTLGRALSQGMRAMGEFVGGVGVGAAIGWQLDEWFGTAPALLLAFLALGTAAGFYNVYRTAAKPTGDDDRRVRPPRRK